MRKKIRHSAHYTVEAMEVLRDHRAAESVRTSAIGALAIASRFAVLGLMLIPGDRPRSAYHSSETQNIRPIDVDKGPLTLDALDGHSIVGPEMLVACGSGAPLTLRIERTRDALRIVVGGKEYGIRNHRLMPTLEIGSAIDDVTLSERIVEVSSDEYGTASIEQSEVERALGILSASSAQTVHVTVAARYVPKDGTPVAMALALKRFWKGDDGSQPEHYEVVFERRNADPGILAMIDASVDGGNDRP